MKVRAILPGSNVVDLVRPGGNGEIVAVDLAALALGKDFGFEG